MDAVVITAFKETTGDETPAITYTPPGGEAAPVDGIFDNAYVFVAEGEAGVASVGPAVFFRLADLPSDPEDEDGTIVTINGATYSVKRVKPDGQGGVVLALWKAQGS